MDIKHVSSTNGRHTFHYLADGNRPVLVIYVDENPDADAKLPILVNGVGKGPDDIQQTKGVTHAATQLSESGAKPYICVNCMARYIVPRIGTLMARVYVPTEVTPLSESMLDNFTI